jgi:hypothetical protein
MCVIDRDPRSEERAHYAGPAMQMLVFLLPQIPDISVDLLETLHPDKKNVNGSRLGQYRYHIPKVPPLLQRPTFLEQPQL